MFLTEESQVMAMGQGESGQLGTGYETLKEHRPQPVSFDNLGQSDRVEQITCGNAHTHFLTKQKYVYACGSNL